MMEYFISSKYCMSVANYVNEETGGKLLMTVVLLSNLLSVDKATSTLKKAT